VEISADYHVNANWRLQAGFTRTILHLTPKPGSTDTGGGATEANDSENQFFLRSSMNLPGRVKLDLNLRHIGEISRQGVPSYEELDVRIAWQATRRLELSLVGQNLLDAQHPEFGDPASRQEIERGVYAKLQWSY